MRTLLLPLLACLATTGCAGLRLRAVQSAQSKPSNLSVFFTVETRAGQPVPQLSAEQFRVYEDGALVSMHESRQTILNPEVAAEHHTLLLVDMSASVVDSGQVPLLVEAATRFTETVGKYQRVAVYAFDGAPGIHAVAPFGAAPAASARASAIAALAQFRPRDPSTNLHGAVVRASDLLAETVSRARTPLRFGTLVVFTDGTDRAGRVSPADVRKALDGHDHEVFAIGVGQEIDEGTLSRIGRAGHWQVKEAQAMQQAFEAVAARIVGYTRSHYLLSYCSPARAGKHRVTIEAIAPDTGKRGRLSYEFDATGFGPGCDPVAPPPFALPRRARGVPALAADRRRVDRTPRPAPVAAPATLTTTTTTAAPPTSDPEAGDN
jgi:hypothetical protein